MTSSDKADSSAIPNTDVSSARLRVREIGEITGDGPCWRMAYDHCNHIQEFAREGLEDPGRLVLFVRRNFSECLTCRFVARTPMAEHDAPLARRPRGYSRMSSR